MTVTSTLSVERKVYSAVGDYTFSFEVFESSDLVLYVTDAAGVVTTLSEGPTLDYTVTLISGVDGGTCHLTYTPTGGTLEIRRSLPVEQSTVWPNNNPFNAKLLESDLDRMVMLIQETRADIEAGTGAPIWKGDWVTATDYLVNDLVIDSSTESSYVCITDHTSGATLAGDLINWRLVFDAEPLTDLEASATAAAAAALVSESNAATSESNASTSESNAATSESNASASAAAAAISETDAAISESNAATSEANAATSETDSEYWAGQSMLYTTRINQNLLIDPNFQINKGYVDGAPLADGEFCRAMWESSSSGDGVSVSGEEITVEGSNNMIQQYNEDIAAAAGKVCTVSFILVSGELNLYGLGMTGSTSTPGSYSHTFTLNTGIPWFRIQSGTADCVFKDLKLEIDSIQTKYEIPLVTVEELKVKRYLRRITQDELFRVSGLSHFSSNSFSWAFGLGVDMRGTPAITQSGITITTLNDTPATFHDAITGIQLTSQGDGFAEILFTVSGFSRGVNFTYFITLGATDYIQLDARY